MHLFLKKRDKNKDKHFIELLKGSSISFLLKILGMILGYFVMLYITKNFGAAEWGVYSLCFTTLSIAIVIPKFGFENSLVRIITELKSNNQWKEIKSVLLKALSISLVLSFLIIIILNVLSDFLVYNVLKDNSMLPYIKIISYGVLPMVILVLVCATFQALKKTALYILFQTVLVNASFLVLLFLSQSFKIEIRIFELYILAITTVLFLSLIVLIFMKKESDTRPNFNHVNYGYRSIIKISTPMLLSSSLALLMGWSDILMLSYFKTSVDVGIYNASLKLAAISGITLIAVNAIATPKFVEFYTQKDFFGLQKTVQNSTKLIFLTSAPILLLLIIFPRSILGFLGEEFSVAYWALIYLCISKFINAISGSVGYIMQMTDQQKIYQNIIFIAFLINIILNVILIPRYSYTGAAIASSIAMIFWNISLVLIIKRKLGFWSIYIPFLIKK